MAAGNARPKIIPEAVQVTQEEVFSSSLGAFPERQQRKHEGPGRRAGGPGPFGQLQ